MLQPAHKMNFRLNPETMSIKDYPLGIGHQGQVMADFVP
mgnify:CR=1 FL=1